MNNSRTLEQRVRERLARVEDPKGGGNLISLGMVHEVEVQGSEVTVVLAMEGPRSPEDRAALEDLVRTAVMSVEEAGDCLVDVLTQPRSPGSDTRPSHHDRPAGQRGKSGPPTPVALPGVGRVIAVASGKGGVGKSTVALNLALALARAGRKVGLLDADMHGPSLPTLLGLGSAQPRAKAGRIEPLRVHNLSVMSLGFLLDTQQPVIWRGPMVSGAIKQLLQDVEWEGLDVLIVDLPPGTGDAQLTLAQTVLVDHAIIVTTPSDLALVDAQRGLQMFNAVHVPVLGIVENMSYFLCPHCEARSEVFGSGGGRRVAREMGVPLLGEIPLDLGVNQGNDQGRPVVISTPESPAARVFTELASRVATMVGMG